MLPAFLLLIINCNFSLSGLLPSESDSGYLARHIEKGLNFLNSDNYDSSLYYFLNAAEISQSIAVKFEERHSTEFSDSITTYWDSHFYCKGKAVSCYKQKADYNNAIKVNEEITEMASIKLDKENFHIGSAYNSLGLIYLALGEFDKAYHYLLRSKEIAIHLYGESHSIIATILNNIGIITQNMGHYDKAIEHYEKALEILGTIVPSPNPMHFSQSYSNIASIYYVKGDYDLALRYINMAAHIEQGSSSNFKTDIYTSYNTIGAIYQKKGELDSARFYYEKALNGRINLLGPDHPLIASVLNNLAILYQEYGNYSKGMDYLSQSNSIKIKKLGTIHPDVAIGLYNMGLMYEKLGIYDSAQAYLHYALEMDITVLGIKHPHVAMRYIGIADVYSNLRNYKKALQHYQLAIISTLDNFNNNDIYKNPIVQNKYLKKDGTQQEEINDKLLLLESITKKAIMLYDLWEESNY